jgi:hypothetical protein
MTVDSPWIALNAATAQQHDFCLFLQAFKHMLVIPLT